MKSSHLPFSKIFEPATEREITLRNKQAPAEEPVLSNLG
jgi:hypothetical protein